MGTLSQVQKIRANGGATLDSRGQDYSGGGYAVALPDHETVVPAHIPWEIALRDYRLMHAETLAEQGNYLGAWIEDSTLVLDVSTIQHSKPIALSLAKRWHQRAIFNLDTMETITL